MNTVETIFSISIGLMLIIAMILVYRSAQKHGDEDAVETTLYAVAAPEEGEPIDHSGELYNPFAIYPVKDIIANMERPEDLEPSVTRLEKLQKVFDHFRYAERGISFKDYLRKIECGTWGELAE